MVVVVELLAPPAVWIWQIHATWGLGGIAQKFPESSVKWFSYDQKIKIVINLFLSTSVCS